MLSRVANSLYWMTRYIERAENTARIVDVNLHLLLDHRKLNDSRFSDYWLPILQSTGDEALYHQLHDEVAGGNVTQFLVFSPKNANSIYSCIGSARENARMIRDQITMEMWEEINRLYLFLGSCAGREAWKLRPYDFLQEIKQSSLYLHGLANATMARDEGWNFMQVGKFLERADMTTRILDVRYQSVPEKGMPPQMVAQVDSFEWSAILRSCSAWDAYRLVYSLDVHPVHVVEYLLLSDKFPRSVRFCASELDQALRSIAGGTLGSFSHSVEKLSGRLLAELQFGTVEEVFFHGFHTYLDKLQQRFNAIGEAVFEAYVKRAFDTPSPEIEKQQEQQQQQVFAVSSALQEFGAR